MSIQRGGVFRLAEVAIRNRSRRRAGDGKFVNTKSSFLGPNSFNDSGGGTSCYRFEATVGHEGNRISTLNTIFQGLNDGATVLSQVGNAAQYTLTTLIGATPYSPYGISSADMCTQFSDGIVVGGIYDPAKQFPGQLTIANANGQGKGMSLAYVDPVGIIDAYNLAGGPNPIKLNPRGGAVQTATNLRISKTGDYPITITDSSIQFDNLGAGGTVIFTLPNDPIIDPNYGAPIYGFTVAAAQTLQINVGNGAATINNGGSVGSAGGHVTCATVGAYIELTNYDTGGGRKWVVKSVTGTWVLS